MSLGLPKCDVTRPNQPRLIVPYLTIQPRKPFMKSATVISPDVTRGGSCRRGGRDEGGKVGEGRDRGKKEGGV